MDISSLYVAEIAENHFCHGQYRCADVARKILNLLHDVQLSPFELKHTGVDVLSTMPASRKQLPSVTCNAPLDHVHVQQEENH